MRKLCTDVATPWFRNLLFSLNRNPPRRCGLAGLSAFYDSSLLQIHRLSKTDRDDRNLEIQLHKMEQYGIWRDLIVVVDETGTTFKRQGWVQL